MENTVQLFTAEDFGIPISSELSSFIKKHTSINDRGVVARKTGVGTSIIRDVAYGYRSLTEDNSLALIELIKIALERIENDREEAIAIPEVKFVKEEMLDKKSA